MNDMLRSKQAGQKFNCRTHAIIKAKATSAEFVLYLNLVHLS